MGVDRAEFERRFVAEMVRIVGPVDAEGDDVAEYAAEAVVGYWDDEELRVEGPEECARTDVSYWEEG